MLDISLNIIQIVLNICIIVLILKNRKKDGK